MKTTATAVVLAVVLLGGPAAAAQSRGFEGIWAGTVELPGRAVDDIVLIIGETEAGAAGTISDGLEIIRPDTGFVGSLTGGRILVFSVPTADGLVLGFALKECGGRLAGVWTCPDGSSGKIELDRRYGPAEFD